MRRGLTSGREQAVTGCPLPVTRSGWSLVPGAFLQSYTPTSQDLPERTSHRKAPAEVITW